MPENQPSEDIYIGLMSGTSADGIDAAAFQFEDRKLSNSETLQLSQTKQLGLVSVKMLGSFSMPYSASLKTQVEAISNAEINAIEDVAKADMQIGEAFAETTTKLLAKLNIEASQVTAIGSHGQTVRHRPQSQPAFSIQIGNPNLIAYRTGITTIGDFRTRDLIAGGQGAPLAPAFHFAWAHAHKTNRAIINVGGIANISWLSETGEIHGFDIGPGNRLMDLWAQEHLHQAYDEDGHWARSGEVIQPLLEKMLQEPYLRETGPKSTGRELFNLNWLASKLAEAGVNLDTENRQSLADIQATLCELTAVSIHQAIDRFRHRASTAEIYLCGGGAHNSLLMERLSQLQRQPVYSTETLGIAADWVEAAAFAWLARQHVLNRPGNIPSVTGAHEFCVLGRRHHA